MTVSAIILAAGKGTRMKSDRHKVLHAVAGRPMIEHLLASAAELAPTRQVVIAGHGRDQIEAALGYLNEPELIHRDNLVLV